jgi:Cu/Zn superoxide dismutase
MAKESAICVLNFSNNYDYHRKGIAYFYTSLKTSKKDKIEHTTNMLLMLKNINVEYGLLKGLHIHECGDITDGCTSACAHYDPEISDHGSLTSKKRHYGDLGNIKIDETGFTIVQLKDLPIRIKDVVGRSLVLHEAEDDLGKAEKRYSMNREEISRKILTYLELSNREICYSIMANHQLLAKQLEDVIGDNLRAIRRWNQNTKQLTEIVEKTLLFKEEKCKESKKTGNSGSRVACGIIGWCKPKNINELITNFQS